eukprot:m.31368 g.31368  ORF g.31368 m.31368 type:complete len:210 (+) comp6924_c0_seq1:4208-4837(+)
MAVAQAAMGPTVGDTGEGFRLTPFLQMGGSTPSPWSLIDWNKVPGTTPTPTQASIHKLERNQFESSFGAAIYDPAEKEDDGSAVPQMTMQMPKAYGSGAAHTASPSDRIVPEAVTSSVRKTKPTSGKAGKTSKGKAGAASTPTKKRTPLTDKDRREKRREQNRRNAAKCRQRKLDRVSVLSEQLEELREENDTLKEQLAQIEQRLAQRA